MSARESFNHNWFSPKMMDSRPTEAFYSSLLLIFGMH